MSLKSAKEKLLSFAISFNSEIKGVGQTPPTIYPPSPAGSLLLTPISQTSKNIAPVSTNPSFQNLRMEDKRIVPYGTAHLFNHDIPAVVDLLSARKLEKQIDNLLLKTLYEIGEGSEKATVITDQITKTDVEIEEVTELLAAIESMTESMAQVDSAFEKSAQEEKVTQKFSEALEAIGSDPLTDDGSTEPKTFLDVMSEITALSPNLLQDYSTTGLFIQALADAEWALRTGVSPSFVIEANQRSDDRWPSGRWRGFSRPGSTSKKYIGESIKRFNQIGVGDSAGYDGVFRSNALKRVPDVDNFTPIKSVAYFCSVLSREFLLSAGLGRTIGAPLGQTFGAASDPTKRVFGTRSITEIFSDQSVPDSLSDFSVVDIEGNIRRKPSKKRVHLFEGASDTSYKSAGYHSKNVTSSKEAWLDTIKTKPLQNKVGIFDDVMRQANDRFTEAEEFLTTILGRDAERTLLSPKGLFARIIKDFAKLLEGLTVETNTEIRGKNAIELMLLAYSAREKASAQKYRKQLKRRMNIFACRLDMLRRDEEDPESAGPKLRVTSREASDKFRGGLLGLGQDKKDVAHALMTIAHIQGDVANPGSKIERTGQQIIDAVADNVEAEGLNSIVVNIFEDLQEEALNLSRLDDDEKSYLREGDTTRNSGFDGAITMAIIYECFATLASLFVNVELELDSSAAHRIRNYRGLDDDDQDEAEYKKKARDKFMSNKQRIRFSSGTGSQNRTNNARRFLLELANAIESNDTSGLIDTTGNIVAVPNLSETSNLGVNTSVTPSELIDIAEDLSREDDVPIKLFAISKSIVENKQEATEDVSARAAALRGDTDSNEVPEDIAILQTLSQSTLGTNFINSLTKSQLKFAQKRLDKIANASEAPYNLNDVPMEIFDAIGFLLEDKKGEFRHAAVTFIGLPFKSISDNLLDKGLTEEEAILKFSIDKIDEMTPVLDYVTDDTSFALKYSFGEQDIVDAFGLEVPPASFNELVLSIMFTILGEDEPQIGSEIIAQSSSPTKTRQYLQNAVESYTLKRMYEILEGVSLMPENVQFNSLEARGAGTKELLGALTTTMNLDKDLPKFFFRSSPDGLKLPDSGRMTQIVQPQKLVVSGIDGWKDPVSTPVQVDMLYNLFSTKPFYVEKVKDIVMTRSIFDEVFAIMVDLDGFEVNKNIAASEAVANNFKEQGKSFTQSDIMNFFKNSQSPDRMNIESMYISAELEGE